MSGVRIFSPTLKRSDLSGLFLYVKKEHNDTNFTIISFVNYKIQNNTIFPFTFVSLYGKILRVCNRSVTIERVINEITIKENNNFLISLFYLYLVQQSQQHQNSRLRLMMDIMEKSSDTGAN